MANATVRDPDAPEVPRGSPEERRRRTIFVALVVGLAVILVASVLIFVLVATDEATFEQPPQGTLEGAELWRQPALPLSFPGVVAGDLVVLGHDGRGVVTEQATLRALDRLTGAERWATTLLSPVVSPVGAASTSLIATTGTDVVAFELETGTERWRIEGPETEDGPPPVATTAESVIVTGATTRSIDPETGGVDWEVDVEGGEPPLVAGGIAFVAGPGMVHALELDDGDVRWSYRMEAEAAFPTPPVIEGDHLVTADREGRLLALDLDDGSLQWRVFLNEDVGEEAVPDQTRDSDTRVEEEGGVELPAEEDEGEVFPGQDDPPPPSVVENVPPDEEALRVVGDGEGNVYVGGASGTLYAYDAADGERRWSRDVSIDFTVPGTIRPAGRVVVTGGPPSRAVLALDARTGRAAWSFDVGDTEVAPVVDERRAYFSAPRPEAAAARDIVGVDLSDGDEAWRVSLTLTPVRPIVLDDGILFVAVADPSEDDDSTIFALR